MTTDECEKCIERRKFFHNLIGWGLFRRNYTRLIFVGIEDGGPPWTTCVQKRLLEEMHRSPSRDEVFAETDQQMAQGRESADKETLRDRYIIPMKQCADNGISDARNNIGTTQRVAACLALKMRRILDPSFDPLGSLGLEEYYRHEFLQRFEISANLNPYSRPTTTAEPDHDWLAYLGFLSKRELANDIKAGKKERCKGLALLIESMVDSAGIVVLMGSVFHQKRVLAQILEGWPTPGPAEWKPLRLRKGGSAFIRHDKVTVCTVPHPSPRNLRRLTEEDTDELATVLSRQ